MNFAWVNLMPELKLASIKEILDDIASNKLLLPDIQREFVWTEEQITNLFNSLMRGYPFGAFLFWKVDSQHSNDYRFYRVQTHYNQLNHFRCDQVDCHPDEVLGVLDGQQRITALNIGFRGSYAVKIPWARKDNPKSYPVKLLYLNLLSNVDDDEHTKFEFSFFSPSEDKKDESLNEDGEKIEWWLRVGKLFEAKTVNDLRSFLLDSIPRSKEKQDRAVSLYSQAEPALKKLYEIIYSNNLISYFEEHSIEYSKVVDIFIRLNSGGTKLSYSDLLFSIAASEWTKVDARKEIDLLLDDINGTFKFRFDRDFVLKAGLLLSDVKSVKFHTSNFTHKNVSQIEDNWNQIKFALRETARLFQNFGYSSKNITSSYVFLPVAYYIERTKAIDDFVDSVRFFKDREDIRQWVNRSILKENFWDNQSDSILTKVREAIRCSECIGFPINKINESLKSINKSLTFSDLDIDNILQLNFGSRKITVILSLINKQIDIEKDAYHIDHIYPRAMFREDHLKKLGFADEDIQKMREQCETLPNLQLLQGNINKSKQAKLPLEWLESKYPMQSDRDEFCKCQCIEFESLLEGLKSFDKFYDQRKNKLKEKLSELIGNIKV